MVLAFHTADGPVSIFIQRYKAANHIQGWVAMKVELTVRFGEVINSHQAMHLLHSTRKMRDEMAQC